MLKLLKSNKMILKKTKKWHSFWIDHFILFTISSNLSVTILSVTKSYLFYIEFGLEIYPTAIGTCSATIFAILFINDEV